MMTYVDRKQRVNAVLERTIGYQLSRPLADRAWKLSEGDGGRLVTAPVFIFSAPRSGSTLLRVILGSHSELYAPPELPLKHLGVRAETQWIKTSLDGLELSVEE